MVGVGDASKTMKYGKTTTEGCLYTMMTALLIGIIGVVLETMLPGQELIVAGRTFYISQEFYQENLLWFWTLASLIGMAIAGIIIRIHQHSVKKRLVTAAKIGRG